MRARFSVVALQPGGIYLDSNLEEAMAAAEREQQQQVQNMIEIKCKHRSLSFSVPWSENASYVPTTLLHVFFTPLHPPGLLEAFPGSASLPHGFRREYAAHPRCQG